MKNTITGFFLFCCLSAAAQVKIHAHNDYEKPVPLTNALTNRAFSIEADVFLRDGRLLVAHNAKDITAERSLDALYLQPIVALFKKNNGAISSDRSYHPALMIDVKEGGSEAIALLAKKLASYRDCFDVKKNRHAVQVIISGDRGMIRDWNNFPSFIFFDGRPNEQYDSQTLTRVALISDGYSGYASRPERIDSVLRNAHSKGKLFRFWGTPDDEKHWKMFHEAGVDIINTDKPEQCRRFFEGTKD
jgi:hypothetical protein